MLYHLLQPPPPIHLILCIIFISLIKCCNSRINNISLIINTKNWSFICGGFDCMRLSIKFSWQVLAKILPRIHIRVISKIIIIWFKFLLMITRDRRRDNFYEFIFIIQETFLGWYMEMKILNGSDFCFYLGIQLVL